MCAAVLLSVCAAAEMPFIVELYDVFKTGDEMSFAMEYCAGGDLFNKASLQPLCTPSNALPRLHQ